MSGGAATSWLPALVELAACGGDWNRYVEVIYDHFCNDFIRTTPSFEKKRWAVKRHPLFKDKEATFWHIVSEGPDENERLPSLRRCERIRWPRAIIDCAAAGRVRLWKQKRGREIRIALAPETFEYLVILAERGDSVLLWTAFPVEYAHQQRKYRAEFERYVRTGQPI